MSATRRGRAEVRGTPLMMVSVPMRVTFGASGAPTLGQAFGAVASIARAAAGRYTITFNDLYHDLVGIAGGGHDYQGTATDGQWQIYTGYVNTTGVVVLSHTVAGSEADPASGNQVDLVFFMLASDTGAF